jgi:hypothetical protein
MCSSEGGNGLQSFLVQGDNPDWKQIPTLFMPQKGIKKATESSGSTIIDLLLKDQDPMNSY